MKRINGAALGAFAAALCIPSYIGTKTSLAADVATGAAAPARASTLCATPSEHPAVLPQSIEQWATSAQLFPDLGDFHRAISTTSPEAQAYFDQGMRFLWAFNHDEATRSFARAAMLDPNCASCYWGIALTIGPNYNLPMMAEPRGRVAWDALQQAQLHSASATPVERALIGALTKRYPSAAGLEPAALAPPLTTYADAMKNVATEFPNDPDVATMTAEALMNINAWKLWALDGTPTPGTEEIVARLESVIAQHPTHPGANHYYIHAIEASPRPDKAVPAAQRLGTMMPAAGHLVHMPAHILQRVGRFEEAAQANEKGAAADSVYFSKTRPLDYYTMYTAHNYQFLAMSRAMQGHRAATIAAGRQSRAAITDEVLIGMPGTDWYVSFLYFGMVRFGMWDAILAEPAPDPKLTGLTVGYTYARTVALVATGRIDDAKTGLATLERVSNAIGPEDSAGLSAAKDVFAVAVLVARARIAGAEGRDTDAIGLLNQAVAQEDKLAYDEPQDWFVPVRHLLGAELIKMNRPAEAENAYREDLRRNPGNGWSLFGLAQALQAQGRGGEADTVRAKYEKVWDGSDVVLTASAF